MLERFLEKSSDNYALTLEQMLTSAIYMEFRKRTMLVPSPVGQQPVGSPFMEFKQINQGREHRFQLFGGDYTALDHTPGDELEGDQYEFDSDSITVDQILAKSAKTALEDEYLSHFAVSPSIVKFLAQGVAEELDDRAMLTAISGARESALTKNGITIHPGGNTVTTTGSTGMTTVFADSAAGAKAIDDDVAELAYNLDVDGVPEEGRFLVIHPHIRRVMRNLPTSGTFNIWDKDYSSDSNDYNQRRIAVWHGFNVLQPYLRFPSTYDLTKPSKYQVDCTFAGTGQPVAVAFCGANSGYAGLGMVQAAGLRAHSEINEYDNTRFFKAQVMAGFGVLHPQCLGLIQAKTS